ncbi:ribonuclease H-like domain-containing protein [Tanacetum coccineum]
MSETEPIPPTSSVTALRIPIIKKGEYDLWSMKMRQYIAITDHILWDIITNGNQTTTDPASPSVSAPKTSLAANARRNNEKALNILLSAIPDRHLLSFHDAVDARSLWKAIKARFGGNEASKKMQKNLLKQQFETFTIGSREELDSAYERFQHILSMLELHDATVSIEDANLKFLRSLPSVWHVVATMIRGQPGLDELDFDDLYNNLKVYEHELKGVSNSNPQNIAFLSTEVKGSTLKQSTAEPTNIPKGYTQAASSKVPTAPNYASHSDEIICSFFSQQASMPTTHDDEDLLQIDEDAMEEIDIRWQVAMITARIRKFMRKTGRSIDLKPKNGITFDKSKIECFNCQKLGHFARECRFAKYQENRANGRQEKKIVAIEDSNSKALVATDNNEDIDWTKEFDAEPVTFAMMALTGVDEDDWSMEIDSEPMHFRQDWTCTRVTITVVPKADHSKSSSSFSDSKQFVCSTCHKYVFNANHDACITKLLKEVNSRAKIQSHKTRNSNKPVDQKSHTQKPGRQIFTGHRFSPNKTSAVYEKTSPRSDLRWKPTGRIFKSVGLRWIPTGKLFDSCTSKVDSEPPHGSNVDIPNIHECKQTLDVSAGTSINVQKEQSLDLSTGTLCNVNKENLRVWLLKKLISQKPLSKWIHR